MGSRCGKFRTSCNSHVCKSVLPFRHLCLATTCMTVGKKMHELFLHILALFKI